MSLLFTLNCQIRREGEKNYATLADVVSAGVVSSVATSIRVFSIIPRAGTSTRNHPK